MLEKVTIAAGDRLLLREACARFESGKLHLIVGPSGSGKSLLLQFVAGLLADGAAQGSVHASGAVRTGEGQDSDRSRVCLVPQQGGLFLELPTRSNIQFGKDHGWGGADEVDIEGICNELGLNPDQPVWFLSGGEARRCAVARALAANAAVILLDEPTAGLDPVAAKRVVRSIASAVRARGVTVVVVTHDYEHFLSDADRVYLLDSTRQRLERVDNATLKSIEERFAAMGADDDQGGYERAAGPGVLARMLDWWGATVLVPLLALRYTLPSPVSFRWLAYFLRRYGRYMFGPGAVAYLFVAGLIAGFVSTYFTFRHLPFREVLEPLVLENVVGGIGFTSFRVTVPVLATLLIAARCGSAVAADVGIKSQTGQLDAMRTLGASPRAYVQHSVLWCLVLGSLFLGAVAMAGAVVSSALTFCALHPERGWLFWNRWFFAWLKTGGSPYWLDGTGWVVARLSVAGWLTGMIAYELAASPKRSEAEVSGAITSTVLAATLAVLVLHVVIALLEF